VQVHVDHLVYSRNLLFRVGGQMDRVFNTIVDRTRARLDVPTLRTMLGAKKRPGVNGTPNLSPKNGKRATMLGAGV
jgi:hypothetical protein